MSRRLPHQITLEELLAALETTSDDTQELISYKNDIPMFLSKFKIEAGSNFVRPRLLYKLYNIYSVEPKDITSFSISCADFIPREGNYFKLNISPIKLTKILNPQTNHNQISSASIKKHYEAFIENGEISKGSKWVEGFLLFEIYRFYCIDNKIQSRLRYEFFITISKLYFEHKRIGSSKGMWFKLDPEVLNVLSEEHQQKVKNDRGMQEKYKLKRRAKKSKEGS